MTLSVLCHGVVVSDVRRLADRHTHSVDDHFFKRAIEHKIACNCRAFCNVDIGVYRGVFLPS